MRDFSPPPPAAPIEVQQRILRRLGAPIRASRAPGRITTKETPARGTSGKERWTTSSWMKLEKCQNNLRDSEPSIYLYRSHRYHLKKSNFVKKKKKKKKKKK